jgi:hypothetical protein
MRCLFKWMRKMPARTSSLGRSTKKISSKRPLRTSSGGKASMSLAVAARKTLLLRSAIQVSSVPSMRLPAPVPSPWLSPPANPVSISSIHSTQGCIASAARSASRSLRSLSPCHLSCSAPKSIRNRGTCQLAAIDLAARLLPAPCTPSSSTPRGDGRPEASGVRKGPRRSCSQRFSAAMPATSSSLGSLVRRRALQRRPSDRA